MESFCFSQFYFFLLERCVHHDSWGPNQTRHGVLWQEPDHENRGNAGQITRYFNGCLQENTFLFFSCWKVIKLCNFYILGILSGILVIAFAFLCTILGSTVLQVKLYDYSISKKKENIIFVVILKNLYIILCRFKMQNINIYKTCT